MDIGRHLFFRGRAGLAAVLATLDLQDGDEVITQAFTCVAVPEGIMAAGGTPIYADLCEGSVNVDPADVAAKISTRTRAIIVQHTFGFAGPVREVVELARSAGILVVEDCCHTFSTRVGERQVGTIGDAAFYSFEWGKPLPCGVGGAVSTSSKAIDDALLRHRHRLRELGRLRQLRLELQYYGFRWCYRPRTYWAVKSLFNRLSAFGAAESNFGDLDFAVPSDDFARRISPFVARRIQRQMSLIPAISQHSRTIVASYRGMELPAGIVAVRDDPGDATLARYPLWADDKQQVLVEARARKIEVADWYKTPIHPLPSASQGSVNYSQGSCPNAEVACAKIVSLPTNRFVDSRMLEKIQGLFSA